jgi:hypothetical protein
LALEEQCDCSVIRLRFFLRDVVVVATRFPSVIDHNRLHFISLIPLSGRLERFAGKSHHRSVNRFYAISKMQKRGAEELASTWVSSKTLIASSGS